VSLTETDQPDVTVSHRLQGVDKNFLASCGGNRRRKEA